MWPYIVIGVLMLFVGMIIARTVMRNQDEMNRLKKENEDLKEGRKYE